MYLHSNNQTPLADEQFGFLSWMWKMNAFTEDEILEECGMDSLCYLRLLYMGYRICGVCVFLAIVLMPVYKYAPITSQNSSIKDTIVQITITNVPDGSPRLVITVVAAYILFGYVMYLIVEVRLEIHIVFP
jgi:Late exocytosis, associated with Golgi transport